uniref:Ubiquitin carboxyl-terminal hydrolase n=1 Tax=Auxenochlorella protothecoides TaxID=3075 RepID=A0A1D2A4N3_AUXPR
MAKKHFVPLESNPEVLTSFAANLGADVSNFQFTDVWGLDPDLLAMVPRPVLAVILLFPLEAAPSSGGAAPEADDFALQSLWYTKQTIGNACGTIAVLHALLNNTEDVALAPGSFLARFREATAAKTPAERAAYLEDPPDASVDITSSHAAAAQAGSTAAPEATADIDLHFVTFVEHGGRLYELDGRREGPVDHGASSRDGLLADTAAVVRRVYLSSSDSLSFNLIALAAAA